MFNIFDIYNVTHVKDMKTLINENLAKEERKRYPAHLPKSVKDRLSKFSRSKSFEMNADISMNEIIIYFLDQNLPSIEELDNRSVA